MLNLTISKIPSNSSDPCSCDMGNGLRVSILGAAVDIRDTTFGPYGSCTRDDIQKCCDKETEDDRRGAKNVCPAIKDCERSQIGETWKQCMKNHCDSGHCYCPNCDTRPPTCEDCHEYDAECKKKLCPYKPCKGPYCPPEKCEDCHEYDAECKKKLCQHKPCKGPYCQPEPCDDDEKPNGTYGSKGYPKEEHYAS